MHRLFLAAGLLIASAATATAQSWVPWNDPPSYRPSSAATAKPQPAPKAKAAKPKPAAPPAALAAVARPAPAPAPVTLSPPPAARSIFADDDDDAVRPPVPLAPIIADGGPRPAITPMRPKEVDYESNYPRGTVVIDSAARRLYLIQSSDTALAYPVSVGREGFTWVGSEKITRVTNWPDWHPPAEMRERDPKLPTKMTGGLKNPLGAKALYLGNTLYRIHGSNDARSIGRAASSGCFRMHNGHVVDLAGRVGVGTRVVVINARDTRTAEERGASSARVTAPVARAATVTRLGGTPPAARAPRRD